MTLKDNGIMLGKLVLGAAALLVGVRYASRLNQHPLIKGAASTGDRAPPATATPVTAPPAPASPPIAAAPPGPAASAPSRLRAFRFTRSPLRRPTRPRPGDQP